MGRRRRARLLDAIGLNCSGHGAGADEMRRERARRALLLIGRYSADVNRRPPLIQFALGFNAAGGRSGYEPSRR